MAAPSASDTELLTEHFGYPPVSLLDDIINSVNILAERALNSVEQGLLGAPPASLGFRPAKPGSRQADEEEERGGPAPEEAARLEIENGTHQLETLLCASIDRNFDKFELYIMRYILTVEPEARDWIRLGHYEGLDFGAAQAGEGAGEDKPSAESVNRLRRRLHASQKLNVMLHAEKARNEAVLEELRALMGVNGAPGAVKKEAGEEPTPAPLAFLRSQGDLAESDTERPLTTTTAFSLSQLQALRALSTSLRTIMPDLQDGEAADTSALDSEGQKSWRRERLEYVEHATRKHLENVRGLELGSDGEVRDSEWQGEGRKLAKGEVEGLEKVVSILGGGQESSRNADAMDES